MKLSKNASPATARSKSAWSGENRPSIRIDARRVDAEFRAIPLNGAKIVKSVVEKFREKYGTNDVKKYYSKFDVAVLIEVVQSTFFQT